MKKFIFLYLLCLFSSQSFSSAIVAGDMNLICLGDSNYEITIRLYNDCAGSDIQDSIIINYQCISDSSLSFSSYQWAALGSGTPSYLFCLPITTSCQGGNAFGYKEYLFNDNVSLDQQHQWKIWIHILGRGIDDATTANANSGFYMETMFNPVLAPGNSTPQFTNTPGIFTYSDRHWCYNHGSVDPNGDSLSFSLVSPKVDSATNISYNTSYNSQNFLPSSIPITINPLTGDLCFNALNDFVGIAKVLIEEWRILNGQATLIGYTQRDIVVHSHTITNNPPELSGMDFNFSSNYNPTDTIYYKEAYATDTIRFRIHAYDIDSGQNAVCGNGSDLSISYISSTHPIDNSNISFYNTYTDSAYADFLWVPKWNEFTSRPYSLALRVIDHWAPFSSSGSDTVIYRMLVKQNSNNIEKAQLQLHYTIYPNPSNGNTSIKLNEVYSQINARVFNVFGEQIIEETHHSTNVLDFDLIIPKGLYFIELKTSNEKSATAKIIIE